MTRAYININISGTIALVDLAKISHLITPNEDNGGLMAGSSLGNAASGSIQRSEPDTGNTSPVTAAEPESRVETSAQHVSDTADDSDEVDAHGWPWSAELHASTKGQTKDGLWRMKVGVSRPDPKPGFPKTTETPSATSTPSPASTDAAGATEPAGSSPTAEPASAAASQDEDDEFAAFREAAAKADAADASASNAVPERVWTDADLGVLCNQAAVKLGDPAPVKALIVEYVPAGEVAHSRNVPADKRAAFVKAVEAKAGIEFAG